MRMYYGLQDGQIIKLGMFEDMDSVFENIDSADYIGYVSWVFDRQDIERLYESINDIIVEEIENETITKSTKKS